MDIEHPHLIAGGRHEDARGSLRFCNDFDMSSVKRFYTIANSAERPKRGWIMHKRESKWLFPLSGKTAVKVRGVGEDGNEVASFLLDSAKPAILHLPPHHWFLIEQDDAAEVMVFSDCRLGEFQNDDFRKEMTE